MSKLDATRRSISATLAELQAGRIRFIAENGIDPIEQWEIEDLKDIIARIERRLGVDLSERAA